MAYTVISETCTQTFYDETDIYVNAAIECTLAMKALLFQKALEQKPEEVMKALTEEMLKAIQIDIWDPVFPPEMSTKECRMIIPQNMNYLEKFKPNMTLKSTKLEY
jgi:hypothetical protein